MSPQVIGLFLFAMLSGTLMWSAQKFLSGYSPLLVNAVALWVGWIIFSLLYLFFRQENQGFQFHRAMILLAIAFVGLNYWYSALYGQGVALAYVPLLVTGGMTILLGAVGYLFFQETITLRFVVWAAIILAWMGIMVIK